MTSSILPEKPNKSAFVFDWIDRVPQGESSRPPRW